MTNLGQDVAYLDQAEFKTFWDADAKRVEDAVRSIGKVDGLSASAPARQLQPDAALHDRSRADHVAGGGLHRPRRRGVRDQRRPAVRHACRRPAPA